MVCRAFKKRTTGQSKTSIEGWDSTYYYDEPSGVSTVLDSIGYITRQQSPKFLSHNLVCKQEIEATDQNLHFPQSDQFVQLPQLESPSLPPMKRLTPISFATENNNIEDDDRYSRGSNSKKVTDWRDLDKFVASQLSHGDRYEGLDVGSAGFGSHSDSDLGLLLLQSGREEAGPKLNELSTSDCDIGICIFNK